ncbi:hypothetical protein H5410_041822 [Solanum commersonii]|uniref:Uncharacterized protein n=1 Tax=Solanum commersonii TaxID=4109 RepID=A0A9J5XVP5_SOLCO|nr:hypothetical protein H5410_041822 [Solanum commersonii]
MRARNKVLQELMCDYVLKFGRILDYKDELLRTNLGRGIERKKYFWKFTRSTFEIELKESINYLKGLRNKIVDDLLYYNPEKWSNVYFNFTTKCDIIDNNMAECFNVRILAAWHKTIITMLEEIRVKMMKRI